MQRRAEAAAARVTFLEQKVRDAEKDVESRIAGLKGSLMSVKRDLALEKHAYSCLSAGKEPNTGGKVITRSEFEALAPLSQVEYCKTGGKIIDN